MARADDADSELADVLRTLGPPGVLWGRLAVEEESPDGPWTPLPGVEVQLYPATAGLLAELERIRRTARDSATQHDTALTRLQAVLTAHQGRAETLGRGLGPDAGAAVAGARRQVTDPAGIFVFEPLPSGPWLLVATRATPYATPAGRREARRPPSSREPRFLTGPGRSRREGEVWLVPVKVGPGERASLFLTDRARWLVGPVP